MTIPWGDSVSAVRARRYGRVKLTFTKDGWKLERCRVTTEDLTTWWWWSFGLSLVLAWGWAGPAYLLGAPEPVVFAGGAPGAILLVVMLVWGLVSAIVEVVAFCLAFLGLFTRKGRRLLFGKAPASTWEPPLLELPANAVAAARTTHHWRRTAVTVRMVDGTEFRYSRFGSRHARRALEGNFAALLGPRLVTAA
ncbi:hypothetical protein [Allokutzneria oryzae]|uniref:DUF2244 domain-containing protein n=1 Tax=Allokutzneria oryzae TaxID=1378989 RepID=A0ABV5ZXQ0_9PSEU